MYFKDICIRIPNWLGRSLCCFYFCDMIKYYFLFPANVSETHNDNIRHLPNISKLNKQHTYHISYAERFFCWDNIKSTCSSSWKQAIFFCFLLRRYIISNSIRDSFVISGALSQSHIACQNRRVAKFNNKKRMINS